MQSFLGKTTPLIGRVAALGSDSRASTASPPSETTPSTPSHRELPRGAEVPDGHVVVKVENESRQSSFNWESLKWKDFEELVVHGIVEKVTVYYTKSGTTPVLENEADLQQLQGLIPAALVKYVVVSMQKEPGRSSPGQKRRAQAVSTAAYMTAKGSEARSKAELGRMGCRRISLYKELLVAEFDNKEMYIAYRGSVNEKDWRENRRVVFDKVRECGGVHQGFYRRAQIMDKSQIMYYLDQGYKVILCGHSLGGAAASVRLVTMLDELCRTEEDHVRLGNIRVITIGAPLFGSEECQKFVHDRSAFKLFEHIVDIQDPVPKLLATLEIQLQSLPAADPNAKALINVLTHLTGFVAQPAVDTAKALADLAQAALKKCPLPHKPIGVFYFFDGRGKMENPVFRPDEQWKRLRDSGISLTPNAALRHGTDNYSMAVGSAFPVAKAAASQATGTPTPLQIPRREKEIEVKVTLTHAEDCVIIDAKNAPMDVKAVSLDSYNRSRRNLCDRKEGLLRPSVINDSSRDRNPVYRRTQPTGVSIMYGERFETVGYILDEQRLDTKFYYKIEKGNEGRVKDILHRKNLFVRFYLDSDLAGGDYIDSPVINEIDTRLPDHVPDGATIYMSNLLDRFHASFLLSSCELITACRIENPFKRSDVSEAALRDLKHHKKVASIVMEEGQRSRSQIAEWVEGVKDAVVGLERGLPDPRMVAALMQQCLVYANSLTEGLEHYLNEPFRVELEPADVEKSNQNYAGWIVLGAIGGVLVVVCGAAAAVAAGMLIAETMAPVGLAAAGGAALGAAGGHVGWSHTHTLEESMRAEMQQKATLQTMIALVGGERPDGEETTVKLEEAVIGIEKKKFAHGTLKYKGKRLTEAACQKVLERRNLIESLHNMRRVSQEERVVVIAGPKNSGKTLTTHKIFNTGEVGGNKKDTVVAEYYRRDLHLSESGETGIVRCVDLPGWTEGAERVKFCEDFVCVGSIGAFCILCIEFRRVQEPVQAQFVCKFLRRFPLCRVRVVVTHCDQSDDQNVMNVQNAEEERQFVVQKLNENIRMYCREQFENDDHRPCQITKDNVLLAGLREGVDLPLNVLHGDGLKSSVTQWMFPREFSG
uniref:Fungal lipase-type domain-containing protein n=1 Tax=Chromera velia CCMP2878 TaxID=1169474 RepID=A0A0G4GEN8_9ALVE|eukprot:Cvel_4603.t1-p1 / transcript=Cvel_4603.t1 / gene=Cvel_4603 / organism=Chromera_velia_CCMP2878 / gene_product=hypothetical protein / transcript_product=hypothetical protein / location=Cvel_scaffold202:60145-64467(+) / protein_length=1104 / sequence_SO=supercontig / SO=protein_coding / is_pseudo=false